MERVWGLERNRRADRQRTEGSEKLEEEGEIGTLGHNGIPTTHGRRVTEMRSEFLCHGAKNHARMDEERKRERGPGTVSTSTAVQVERFPRARAGCVDASASRGQAES